MDGEHLTGPGIIQNLRTHCLVTAVACLVVSSSVWAQSAPESAEDALALLQKASQQYVDLKTYKIVKEETFTSENPINPAPTMMTAIKAPMGRYRFEVDIGFGNDIQVSDGQVTWFYQSAENAYTQRAVNDEKTAPSRTISPADIGASLLRDMAQFAADYKSAQKLSDANLILSGRWLECYVIELSNDGMKIPQLYPFTETVWIAKKSFKIRKIVQNYILTTLQRGGKPPITFPATRVSIYPEVSLNEPIPDAVFQFTPPATAHLVSEFPPDLAQFAPEAGLAGQRAPNVMLRSIDGSRLLLDSFHGHPLLIDIWATWCGPCIEGFVDLARLYDGTHPTGLAVVSIDVADDPRTAQEYLLKMHYPWPNFHDHGEVEAAFGTERVPRAILIDAKGEIVFDHVSSTPQELRAAIAKLGPEYAAAVAALH